MSIQNTKAFTLVEIMITVALIGLLTTISLPAFLKARTTTRTNVCINNLRIIEAAKEQYAMENGKDSSVTPDPADITLYIKTQTMPECPESGDYSIEAIGTSPTCTVSGHTL